MIFLRKWWQELSIIVKTRLLSLMIFLVICATVLISVVITLYSSYYVGPILSNIASCEAVQETLGIEDAAFRDLVRNRNDETIAIYESSREETSRAIARIPFEYKAIGAERYARSWNLINAYEHYCACRDEVLAVDIEQAGSIKDIYSVYDQMSFLKEYARRLTQLTVEEGSDRYISTLPFLRRLPFILFAFDAVILIFVYLYNNSVGTGLIKPIRKLAGMARKVSVSDFSGSDVVVPNRDEIGELVDAFNKMKHAMEEHIRTLNENHSLSEKLHHEELERVEMEKELDSVKINLLKSQINPHFLFNTLNSIAGMADIEDAETTRKMIMALSNIFRYNLNNASETVSLRQELNIVSDYMYLQKMRFGDRLTYEVNENADARSIIVPVFLLQPLVENAVGHGIHRKESGGVVRVNVSEETADGRKYAIITIDDNGEGIDEERLREITTDSEGSVNPDAVGIGMGNITRRINSLYTDGKVSIRSIEGTGTTVTVTIPQE